MFNGNFKAAIASLRSSKWRSILTMLGIVIGVSSVVTMVSLGEGLKQQIVGQINQLGSDIISVRSGKLVSRDGGQSINNINVLAFLSTSTLTENDIQAISKLPSVANVVPMSFVTNSAKGSRTSLDNLYVVGTSPDLAQVLHQKVAYGAFFRADEVEENFAIVGSTAAQELLGELNPVGQSINIMGQEFVVRGVLEKSSGGLLSVAETDFNSAVFISQQSAKKLTGTHPNILQILVKSRDPSNLDIAANDIRSALLATHRGQENFTVLKQYELLDIAGGVVNIVTAFITGIAAISLLVGGIGIMDIMLVSVSERMREIGIRKAVGATNRQILGQFLVEGLALSIGGGLVGVLIALFINLCLRLYTNFEPVVSVPLVILAVGVSVSVGIIFSVAPALKAARKNPIDALRNG